MFQSQVSFIPGKTHCLFTGEAPNLKESTGVVKMQFVLYLYCNVTRGSRPTRDS